MVDFFFSYTFQETLVVLFSPFPCQSLLIESYTLFYYWQPLSFIFSLGMLEVVYVVCLVFLFPLVVFANDTNLCVFLNRYTILVLDAGDITTRFLLS